MIGSDKAKVPAQSQTLKDAGDKQVSDFISADTKIGADGAVIGTLKKVDNLTSFGGKSGYFFPITLDAKYKDKEIKVTGVNGPKTARDLEWLIEISGVDTTVTFEADSSVFLTLTFKDAAFEGSTGKDAVRVAGQDENMDAVKKASALIDSDVTISWADTTGTVSGTAHWYDFTGTTHFTKFPKGHFMPVVVKGYDGQEITATGSDGSSTTLKDPKWIIRVDNFTADKEATLAVKEKVIAKLKFTGLTLEPPVGKAAFNATKDNYGSFGKNSVYYKGGSVNIEWTGTTAKVTGELNWVDTEARTPYSSLTKDSYYFAFALDEWFGEKEIKVTGNEAKTETATDWVMLVDAENKMKGFDVEYNDTLIAHFDLSEVVLASH